MSQENLMQGIEAHMFIAGRWVDSDSGGRYERANPATRSLVGSAPDATARDVDRAVAAAVDVHRQGTWRRPTGAERQRTLNAVAAGIREASDELTSMLIAEAGKPRWLASFEVDLAADYFAYYAGLTRAVGGRTIPALRPDTLAHTRPEPAGVTGIITPWNFPLISAAQKSAPALAAGCPVVMKPAPLTPFATLKLADVMDEAGIPSGVFNVITESAPGSATGQALVQHHDVAVVSFTGSTITGSRIMEMASAGLKRVTLECGGKSPCLVHADADIESAVDSALFGICFNTGQVCNGLTRLFLHDEVADEFLDSFIDRAERLIVGDPADEHTQLGPLVSAAQLDRVRNYVSVGIDERAKLPTGGSALSGALYDTGHYFQPTVFDQVEQHMRIAQEEIFGPVLAVSRYRDLNEALQQANDTSYGLAGGVWTRSSDVAETVVSGLEVGMVWINDWLAMFPETPHGGYGLSGIGREMGPEALDEFTENKTVIQKFGERNQFFS